MRGRVKVEKGRRGGHEVSVSAWVQLVEARTLRSCVVSRSGGVHSSLFGCVRAENDTHAVDAPVEDGLGAANSAHLA